MIFTTYSYIMSSRIQIGTTGKRRFLMDRIFDLDNPFFRFIGKLVDVVLLNLLWVIFSLPIVTMGASTTALYHVTLKLVRDREGYMFRSFLKAFKENFKQSTIIWIIFLLAGTILATDIYVVYNMEAKYSSVLVALFIGISVVSLFVLIYIFPLQAQFDNPIKQTFKNALLISIKHLPWTILLVIINVVVGVLIYLYAVIAVLFGFGMLAFINSYIFSKIFLKYIPEEEIERY